MKAVSRKVALPSHLLVDALNAHMNERAQGNEAYRGGDMQGALGKYTRALAIVDMLEAQVGKDLDHAPRGLAWRHTSFKRKEMLLYLPPGFVCFDSLHPSSSVGISQACT